MNPIRINVLFSSLIVSCSGVPNHPFVENLLPMLPDANPPMYTTPPIEHINIGQTKDAGTINHNDAAIEPTAFVLQWTPKAVEPGSEGLNCIDLYSPNKDFYISGWTVHKETVHHINLWFRKTGTQPYSVIKDPCPGGWGQGRFIFDDSDSGDINVDFDSLGAIYIPANTDLILDVHYLNTTTKPMQESIDITLHEATKHSPLINGLNIIAGNAAPSVPPGVIRTTTFTELSPASSERIIAMTGHMHAHGILETVNINNQEYYRNTIWSDPTIVWPNIIIDPKTKVTWACTVNNTTPNALPYGASDINTAEMCSIFGLVVGPQWERTGTVVSLTDAGLN